MRPESNGGPLSRRPSSRSRKQAPGSTPGLVLEPCTQSAEQGSVARPIVIGAVATEVRANIRVGILEYGVAAPHGVLVVAGLDILGHRRGGNEGGEGQGGNEDLHGGLPMFEKNFFPTPSSLGAFANIQCEAVHAAAFCIAP